MKKVVPDTDSPAPEPSLRDVPTIAFVMMWVGPLIWVVVQVAVLDKSVVSAVFSPLAVLGFLAAFAMTVARIVSERRAAPPREDDNDD